MTNGIVLDHVTEVPPLTERAIDVAVREVTEEIGRQDRLARARRFSGTHIMPSGPDVARLAVLAEEFGEVAREVTEGVMNVERSRKALRKELLQVAAVAVAWAAAIGEGR